MNDEATEAVLVSTGVGLSTDEARYSHSCTDLSSYITLSTPRDAAYTACYKKHLSPTPPPQDRQTPTPPDNSSTPTPPDQPSRRPSSTPSTQSHPQLSHQPLSQLPHRPVTATRSAPRAVLPSSRFRCYDNPPRHSPGRAGPSMPDAIGNGTKGHQGLGLQMSWSPARQVPHTPMRPRVYSDCYARHSPRSRSFRIKQWIQARQTR